MAVYPGMIKSRDVRSTTIIQPNAANSVGTIVNRGSISSKAQQTSSPSKINPEDAKNPERLVRILNQIQQDLASATQAARTSPLSSPCIVRGVILAPNQVTPIPHTLKRNYTEFHPSAVSAPNANVALGLLHVISVVPPTTQYPANQFCVVQNLGNVGVTFNAIISGD